VLGELGRKFDIDKNGSLGRDETGNLLTELNANRDSEIGEAAYREAVSRTNESGGVVYLQGNESGGVTVMVEPMQGEIVDGQIILDELPAAEPEATAPRPVTISSGAAWNARRDTNIDKGLEEFVRTEYARTNEGTVLRYDLDGAREVSRGVYDIKDNTTGQIVRMQIQADSRGHFISSSELDRFAPNEIIETQALKTVGVGSAFDHGVKLKLEDGQTAERIVGTNNEYIITNKQGAVYQATVSGLDGGLNGIEDWGDKAVFSNMRLIRPAPEVAAAQTPASPVSAAPSTVGFSNIGDFIRGDR
jgi:hypothetical protein